MSKPSRIPPRIIDGHFHSSPGTSGFGLLSAEHFEHVFDELPQLECVVTSSLAGAGGSQRAGSDETAAVIEALGAARVKGSVWVVPGEEGWRDDAERRLDDGFVALKVHGPANGYAVGPATVGPVMELARERGVPVTFHFSDPDGLEELAAEFPGVAMVFFHSGAQRGMEIASRHENVILETSVAGNALIEKLVGAVGAGRVMFGCDAPLCWCAKRDRETIGVGSYYDNLVEICGLELTDDELATICYDVPRRVYGL